MSWPQDVRHSPAEQRWAISYDFDGTITLQDMVQAMLNRFADTAWRDVETEWEAGLIGSRECLARQTDMLRVSEIELARWVDQQPIDPDVANFFADCARRGHDLRIVSDGYDWVIARVMSRLKLEHIPVFANRLRPLADGAWSLEFPYAQAGCMSGVCKCRVLGAGRPRLHIGDGRSDFCVSNVCDRVFAKGALLASRNALGQTSVGFERFADLAAPLALLCAPAEPSQSVSLRSAVG